MGRQRTSPPIAGSQIERPDGARAPRFERSAGLGKSLRELGKPADAAAAFAAVLELAPTDPVAPEVALAQGRALEADKQFDAALKSYSLILEKFAKSDQAPQAALAQARLFARAGRRDDAARAFERLIDDQHARDALQSAGVTARRSAV